MNGYTNAHIKVQKDGSDSEEEYRLKVKRRKNLDFIA